MATFAFASMPATLSLNEVAPQAAGAPPAGKPARLTGTLQFSVHNLDQRFARVGRLSVQPAVPAQAGWFSFKDSPSTNAGQTEIEFEKDATQTVTLLVAVPPDAAAGKSVFTIRIAAENDPDNDVADSPSVGFTVPEVKVVPPPAKTFPVWAVIAAVAVLAVAGGAAGYIFWPSGKVAIPELAGKARDTAVKELTDRSLVPSVTQEHAAVDANQVIRTEPAAGTSVPKQTPVKVVVSDGKVIVPRLQSQTVVDAIRVLDRLKLRPRTAGVEPSPQPVGTIVSSQPAAGAEATVGQNIDLVLASPAGVPNPCHQPAPNRFIFCNPQVLTSATSEQVIRDLNVLRVTPVR